MVSPTPHIGGASIRDWEGVTIGGKNAPIKLRIYDKLRELVEKDDAEGVELMQAYRWGGEVDSAIRVEYQLK